jgi:hypothetical protein
MIDGVTMSYRAAHGASADSVKTLFKVLNNGDTVKIALLAIKIASASILGRRTGLFPKLVRDRRPRLRAAPRAQRPRLPVQQRRSLCVTDGDADRASGLGTDRHGGRGPANP